MQLVIANDAAPTAAVAQADASASASASASAAEVYRLGGFSQGLGKGGVAQGGQQAYMLGSLVSSGLHH